MMITVNYLLMELLNKFFVQEDFFMMFQQ